MLNNSGDIGHSCLVPDLRGNAFSFSPLRIMFAVDLSYMGFLLCWGRFLLCPFLNTFFIINYHTIALVSHTSKVMLKILQARLQQYVNHELPDVQVGFRKGRDQIANICWIIEKARSSRKPSISALLTMPKPLTVWITRNCGKLWKIWEYQTTWPASWETCMQIRKQQLELDMEQQTGSK